MLLNKEEAIELIHKWRDTPSEEDAYEQLCRMFQEAERDKAAPHFDALSIMMGSREVFMAGAEWGKAQVDAKEQQSDAKERSREQWCTALAHKLEDIAMRLGDALPIPGAVAELKPDRRAERLELAGKLAVAWTQNPGYEIDPSAKAESLECYGNAFAFRSAAIIDAVDKEVGKPAEDGRDHEGDFQAWYATDTTSVVYSEDVETLARAAFLAARGVTP